jgi:hypothetical protein
VEMLIGLSAPAIAWISLKGANGRRIAVGWGVLGLLSLVNVSARAASSAGTRDRLDPSMELTT